MIVQDQMKREIDIKNFPPNRIISLVPSITELLVELGLSEKIVGITKFCIHPEEIFKSKEKIGGTKNLNIEKIKTLQPDLIIGNKEENVKSQIEELEKLFPVWMSDVNTYEDALDMIQSIGKITNTENTAYQISTQINLAFEELKHSTHLLKNKRVLYLIWYQPYMAVANQTFIHNMLLKIGAINVLQNQNRYVELDVETMKTLSIDYVLLSSEPFPFKEKHKEELQTLLGNKTKVILVDGEVFSWYGVRMRYLPSYLRMLGESI